MENLWLDENPLGSLNNIQGLKLKTLNVDYAEIASLKPLRNMVSLEELTADSNKISDLKPLRLLVNLRVVDLSFNKISSLEGIEGLRNLEKLDLDKNMISDFEELRRLQQLEKLKTFCLKSDIDGSDNPLTHSENYRERCLSFCPKSLAFFDYKDEDYVPVTDSEKNLLAKAYE